MPEKQDTLGGIDTGELDSTTMQARKVPGLYVVGEVVDITLPKESTLDGVALRELQLPAESLIAFVIRGGESIFPTGATTLKSGDEILALTRPKHEEELRKIFFARSGPAVARPR